MRTFARICILAMSLFRAGAGPLQAGEPRRIVWYRDYELALSEAKLLGRPILVHVASKWSPACLRLERSTFVDPKLVEFVNGSMLAVYVDADASSELAARLHVASLPVDLVLSADGIELGRIEGFRNAESFVAEMSRSISRSPATRSVRPTVMLSPIRSASESGTAERPPEIRLAANVEETRRDQAVSLSGLTPLMLDGYCPVSMCDAKKLVPGEPQFQTDFDGQTICFAGPEQLEKFRGAAARYMPVLGGCCPVSFVEQSCEKRGSSRFAVLCRNRLYIFAGLDERMRFQSNPTRYVDCDLASDGQCPVCAAETGRGVPGDRAFEYIQHNRLYRFDAAEHLRRFAASPQSFTKKK